MAATTQRPLFHLLLKVYSKSVSFSVISAEITVFELEIEKKIAYISLSVIDIVLLRAGNDTK